MAKYREEQENPERAKGKKPEETIKVKAEMKSEPSEEQKKALSVKQ